MSTTIRVTTTPATVLRHVVELGERRDGEDAWEMQARTLEELGYCVVGKDTVSRKVADELRYWAEHLSRWREGDVIQVLALRDILRRRADELDPQGDQS